ncbi:HNH endonuclease [Paenibacillus sp. Soil750]|uniref:HNH endonuclease n=1 Tax=Paenibacillus sp. Soil750 TaxID=1736398 RepID=UPI0006F36EAF|nr:HNH endonuclease [Paenibacillus sp. Soil750]KRE71985.1 hypothetical protein ASL11_09415 [Paenibacillus sp. Soil750]
MLESFNSLCEFRRLNPGTKGSAMLSNDPVLEGVKKDLSSVVDWLKDRFQGYKGVTYTFEQSKGIARFPSIFHVSLLPPGQQVSKGIYVVICFDIKGRGALIGCAESKTNPQGLNRILRSKNKDLRIDVDGRRPTTKYNDVFENPKEFYFERSTIEEIEEHLKESLELCLYHLKLIQDKESDLKISTLVQANSDLPFNPENINNAKEKIARYISYRRGQKKFREKLLAAYNGRCAVTGCDVLETLEAAHIVPYHGEETNNSTNGLLLRGDIHTLFDLGLITINSGTLTVRVSSQLNTSIYWYLHNQKLNLPEKKSLFPSEKAIEYHNRNFQD